MKDLLRNVAKSVLMRTTAGEQLVRAYSLRPYLDKIGWFRSVGTGMPLDREGLELPWYTYSAIRFVSDRIRPEMTVFEFGSGNSTIWWSRRVKAVTSCEHSRDWYEQIKAKAPANVDYKYAALDGSGDYSATVAAYTHEFDCIVIDGRDRVNCAKQCLAALKPDGVVIWDNSDRSKYAAGYEFLQENGFKRVDFWGLGPINSYQWCTSVFYRPDNCFGL